MYINNKFKGNGVVYLCVCDLICTLVYSKGDMKIYSLPGSTLIHCVYDVKGMESSQLIHLAPVFVIHKNAQSLTLNLVHGLTKNKVYQIIIIL